MQFIKEQINLKYVRCCNLAVDLATTTTSAAESR